MVLWMAQESAPWGFACSLVLGVVCLVFCLFLMSKLSDAKKKADETQKSVVEAHKKAEEALKKAEDAQRRATAAIRGMGDVKRKLF